MSIPFESFATLLLQFLVVILGGIVSLLYIFNWRKKPKEHDYHRIRFKRYGKMEKYTQNYTSEGTWVATEKVHGANFSFVCDGKSVQCAKRNGELAEFDKFYRNWYPAAKAKFDSVLQTFRCVKKLYPEAETIHIFCEFFGGHYPHPKVQQVPSVQYVQKGLWYCPHYEFYSFDLCVNGTYLMYPEMVQILKPLGWFIAEPLCTGTYDEVSAFEVEGFKTTIPGRLGLPQLENPCEAEGVVLRRIDFGGRVKKKTIAFREHGKQKGTKKPKQAKAIKTKVILTPEEQSLIDKASSYIVEARLENVISKIGREAAMQMNPAKLVGLFVKDAKEDWSKDNEVEIRRVWPKEEGKKPPKTMHAMLSSQARSLVSTWRKSFDNF